MFLKFNFLFQKSEILLFIKNKDGRLGRCGSANCTIGESAVQQRPVNMDTTQVVQLINEINDIIVDAHGNFLFIIFSGNIIRIGLGDDEHTIYIQNKEVIRILSEELGNLTFCCFFENNKNRNN